MAPPLLTKVKRQSPDTPCRAEHGAGPLGNIKNSSVFYCSLLFVRIVRIVTSIKNVAEPARTHQNVAKQMAKQARTRPNGPERTKTRQNDFAYTPRVLVSLLP